MRQRRPVIDKMVKDTVDKIASQATDELVWCQQHFKAIYNRLTDWGEIDTHYDDVTFSKAEQICKDKLQQIQYVIKLRKQRQSAEVSNGKL